MTSTTKSMAEGRRIAVIGGGAAGMMAAIRAADAGGEVTLFERNDRLGKKLRITGKGRCNLTNDCEREEFLRNVPTNPRFLYTALSAWSPEDTKVFFESLGVPLKTERGKRVFPISDRAADVVSALERACRARGVEIVNRRVRRLLAEDGEVKGLAVGAEEHTFDAVILCTGGKSYPLTGSDGDGYRMAEELGHKVTRLCPSLVPLVEDGRFCASMQGLSLKNVTLRVLDTATGKCVFEDFGELMFTHFGLTGPLVLSASAHLSDIAPGKYTAEIDLKPALDPKTLDARIRSDFEKYKNRDLINALDDLLPQKLIEPFISLCAIDPRKKIHSVTREERTAMVQVLKGLRIPLRAFRPLDEAIVTRGGIDVREVKPKTMESKLIRGLYFAGEVLDVDAYTGGFNLQIAFSTAVLAGDAAAGQD